MQQPHLKGLGGAPGLAPLAVKNIRHRGHADRRDALEGIVLDKVGRFLVGRQRRRIDQPRSRLQYRLAVQVVQVDLVRRRRFLSLGPGDGL